jgi:hypothetical protein
MGKAPRSRKWMDERSSAEKNLEHNPPVGKSIEAMETISRYRVAAKVNRWLQDSQLDAA